MAVLHPANETAYARAAVRLTELEQMPMGAGLYSGLIELHSIPLGSAAAVRATALWTKLISHCQAQSMITTTEAMTGCDLLVFASGHDAKQIVGEELAAMTHVSSGAGIDGVYLVAQVGDTLPLSWEALNRGDLTLDHLRRLAKITRVCTPRVANAVDARVIPDAIRRGWTPGELANAATKAVIVIDPDGAADRAAKAKAAADVRFYPSGNETAILEANGDAAAVRHMMDAIEARAAQLEAQSGRLPVGVRRFNALADLVLGPAQAAHPNVEVIVNIDLDTWLGLNQRPAELSGYGPITAEAARELAADASFRRMITDPVSGATLDLGRQRYRPSAALRRFVEARDWTCRFPGCQRPARFADLDHREEFDHENPANGGATDPRNLHVLCRMHHNLKTRKFWHVDINPDGSEIWTSALGFVYLKPAAAYPVDLLEPPDEDELADAVGDVIPEADPDPPCPVELLTPPPLTDTEYLEFYDAIENSFGAFADRAYDTLRCAGLIA